MSTFICNSKFHPLPDFLSDKVLCNNCNHFLSVPPIYNSNNGHTMCGRCVDMKNPQGIRNELYETLLEMLSFPCMNKQYGCLEFRTGKTMWNHEVTCSYRRVNCPLAITKSCDWVGDVETILEHFEDHHSMNLMKEPSFEVNFLDNFEDVSMLPYSDSLFLVRRHGDVDKNKFWCSVQAIQRNEFEKFEYSLSLKNPVSGKIQKFDEKRVNSLSDQDGFEIETNKVQKYLEKPVMIIATIDIIEFKEDSNKGIVKSTSLSNVDMEMLKAIECPVCFEYMVPPIFQCEIGHSICGKCKGLVSQCPTCRRPFGDAQNFAVENLTSYIKYPCKNLEKGCEFVSNAKTIKQHESSCQFGAFKCPTFDYTSCSWSGLRQHIWEHCKQKHKDNLIECYSVSLPFDPSEENEDEDCFIINYMRNVFVLHWKYLDKVFYWSVQLVGPYEESKNYYFDLDIIDRSGRNLRIFMRGSCEAFSGKCSAFEDNKSFLFLTLDQVKPLINDVFAFKPSVSRYPSNAD
ncbi:uncharacterized protein LOC123315556 [Coccinella septempunctata]|uniref:uncharacterized protein LOC123315556 n=1 Tax=Coccinella septempunctata TaxID=41139 RepID=UPI001D07B45F|nr:uncharacterized protein LOC123315556 [Coccinella septempunctata]XP_044757231.1 uncharacterized protein LOC123315556 [Coccinella septempunctata]XP_044757233.1 uncharacterized protein LOC123315556 [Coccinella septempunctata]